MDSVALALFRFSSRTRQKAGAAVRAPGAGPHPHPHPHECNYGRGELLIHGQDTYKKIKLDLKAMNETLINTKESEHAPP